MDSWIFLVLIALLVGIGVIIAIYLAHKKKEKNAFLMPHLNAWITHAKAVNYNYTQMKTLLEINDWDKKLIEKALEDNGVHKPVV